MNSMKIKGKEADLKYIGKATFCIAAGTGIGLLVYGFFLHFNIAILGWNLGLIFAPLVAGYVETILADRIIGNNLGAISAFLLFIDTTFYSFILKNPTLGMNLITAGSIVVILQAAFPTFINYILLIVLGAIASNFSWVFKKITGSIERFLRKNTKKPYDKITVEENTYFDEAESNKRINSLNFFFMTSTDMKKPYEITGIYHSEIIFERDKTISIETEELENKRLTIIKQGKDECLVKLSNKIKEDGGNGVLDLDIKYGLIGLGGDNIHITSTGMGIKIIN